MTRILGGAVSTITSLNSRLPRNKSVDKVLGEIKLSESLREYLSKMPDLDLDLLLEAYRKPLPTSFRVNTLKMDEHEVLEMLKEKGVSFKKIPWTRYGYVVEDEPIDLGKTVEHMLGLIYIQAPISMVPVEVLNPKPGEKVLDLCAAPGSKSTQIAQFLDGLGVLVANDVSFDRVKALASNLQRFGVLNVIITLMDGRKFPRFARECFDKVLVDAPCSSLGIVSKNWGIARSWNLELAKRLSKLQRQLIIAGFDCLKPGGELVYATCTLTVEENEMVVQHLLERREDAVLKEINLPSLGYRCGIVEWDGMKLDEGLEKTIRIMPYDNWAEGFYVARVLKEGDS